jgi:hypothetical protein
VFDTHLSPALSPRKRAEREKKSRRPLVVFLFFSPFSAQGRNSIDTALA